MIRSQRVLGPRHCLPVTRAHKPSQTRGFPASRRGWTVSQRSRPSSRSSSGSRQHAEHRPMMTAPHYAFPLPAERTMQIRSALPTCVDCLRATPRRSFGERPWRFGTTRSLRSPRGGAGSPWGRATGPTTEKYSIISGWRRWLLSFCWSLSRCVASGACVRARAAPHRQVLLL